MIKQTPKGFFPTKKYFTYVKDMVYKGFTKEFSSTYRNTSIHLERVYRKNQKNRIRGKPQKPQKRVEKHTRQQKQPKKKRRKNQQSNKAY